MSYADDLRTPMWQMKRLDVLTRDKWTCRICGNCSLKDEKQVHHCLYYGKPWEIDSFWLITVCVPCHNKLEDKKKNPIPLTDEYYQTMYEKFNNDRKYYLSHFD